MTPLMAARLGTDRTISPLACVLLVTLRMFIGWHLFYEGVWKLETQQTATPWTAEGYLKNATGPLRPVFQGLTGDPGDMSWLDYDQMTAKWNGWRDRFVQHYSTGDGTADSKLASDVDLMLKGATEYSVPLAALPAQVDLSKAPKSVRYDAAAKSLIVDGKLHLLPDERDALLALAGQMGSESEAYRSAVEKLFKVQAKLSFQERLAALLKGDPERVGVEQKDQEGARIEARLGQMDLYRAQVKRYEESLTRARQSFQWDHLARQQKELSDLRRQVIGPIQALETELYVAADQLLTEQQLSLGAVPKPWTQQRSIDWRTMWTLTIVGVLLMAGLLTRPAAIAGAGLLTLFYLAAPPWPGTPPEYGVEHNYIVNKVLIEAAALLALAALPSGRWFGVDALFVALGTRFRQGRAAPLN